MNPRKSYTEKIVRDKRAWEEPPEVPEAADDHVAPFKGWYSRGYLPHCDKPSLVQMITIRLEDALPASRRHEWAAFLEIEDDRERQIKIEDYLDKGYGECHLKDPRLASVVEQAFLHFDGVRYRLCAWAVMPNHAHLLYEAWLVPLSELLKSWKGYTAYRCNEILGRKGTFWQEEYFDRYMRDEAHLNKAVRYIENNPMKAGLVRQAEDWAFSSANPKWQWSGDGRFARNRGAHVVHANWEKPTTPEGARTFLSARPNPNEDRSHA